MAGSYGGTIKLTGEDEYKRALSNITSNLKSVSSELKLVSAEFTNNGNKVGNLRIKNEALNKKLQEEREIVKTCYDAVKNFTEQQSKNKDKINEINNSLNKEINLLNEMKNSTTATKKEISEQEKVVEKLTKQLEESNSTYDQNNRKINDYKTKLNDAKTQCSNLSKEIQDNNNILSKTKNNFNDNAKSIKEFATQEDNAGNSALKLGDIIKGNLISEGIVSGIKALGSAMKNVASSLMDIGKQAINNYADYEQLVGGVETLFALSEDEIKAYADTYGMSVDEVKSDNELMRSSMNEVFSYANDAYKTAGLSANEYMEMVTSFSASLLQSLNGNSFDATEKANQAIIDMSDNANKMGTDISMIQSAYQGFAKQNYTMLDNLKLGYGGTKTEMERLLADAEKISGVKYDLSSYADIVDAIHVMQESMGIAGTTSKEASTTIQGSVGAMKSAWQNLLTGVADDNANFGDLINNFVDSIVTVGDNLIPRIEIAVDGIVNLIMGLADKLVERLPELLNVGMEMLQSILNGFMSMLPQLTPVVVQLITNLTSFILQNLPQLLQAGVTLLLELAKGISQALPELIPVAVKCIMDLVNSLLDNIDEVIECGIQLLVALTDGIFNALPELIARLPEIIIKITEKLIELTPQLLSCVLRLMVSIATGMVKYTVEIVSRIPEIIKSIVNALLQGVNDMINIGKNLVEGIWNGISGSFDWIKNKIKGWVGDVTKFIKKLFGINSPSKVFKEEIGTNLALGIGEGFEDTMSNVSKNMASSIPTEFDTNVNINSSSNISRNGYSSNYDLMVDAFKEALKGTKVVMNDREFGAFVTDTMEKVVYS